MRECTLRKPFSYRVGFKTTPGATLADLLAFEAALPDNLNAVAFVVQDVGLTTQLYHTDIYTVAVPWSVFPGDCPNTAMSPVNSARNRLRYVDTRLAGALFDAVVLTNECAWPSAEYYRDWTLEALEGCDERGWTCITHVWNAGTPDLDWLPVLDDVHCEMEARGHYYGSNIYPVDDLPLMSREGIAPYTTWRHEMIMERMRCSPEWAITELAPGYGFGPPAVQDTARYLKATQGLFALVGVWYYSPIPTPIGPDANWVFEDMLNLAGELQ